MRGQLLKRAPNMSQLNKVIGGVGFEGSDEETPEIRPGNVKKRINIDYDEPEFPKRPIPNYDEPIKPIQEKKPSTKQQTDDTQFQKIISDKVSSDALEGDKKYEQAPLEDQEENPTENEQIQQFDTKSKDSPQKQNQQNLFQNKNFRKTPERSQKTVPQQKSQITTPQRETLQQKETLPTRQKTSPAPSKQISKEENLKTEEQEKQTPQQSENQQSSQIQTPMQTIFLSISQSEPTQQITEERTEEAEEQQKQDEKPYSQEKEPEQKIISPNRQGKSTTPETPQPSSKIEQSPNKRTTETPEQQQSQQKTTTPSRGQSKIEQPKTSPSRLGTTETPEKRNSQSQIEQPKTTPSRMGTNTRKTETPEQRQSQSKIEQPKTTPSRMAETPEQRQSQSKIEQPKITPSRMAEQKTETPEQRKSQSKIEPPKKTPSRITETPEQRKSQSMIEQPKTTPSRIGTNENTESQAKIEPQYKTPTRQSTTEQNEQPGSQQKIEPSKTTPSRIPEQKQEQKTPIRQPESNQIQQSQKTTTPSRQTTTPSRQTEQPEQPESQEQTTPFGTQQPDKPAQQKSSPQKSTPNKSGIVQQPEKQSSPVKQGSIIEQPGKQTPSKQGSITEQPRQTTPIRQEPISQNTSSKISQAKSFSERPGQKSSPRKEQNEQPEQKSTPGKQGQIEQPASQQRTTPNRQGQQKLDQPESNRTSSKKGSTILPVKEESESYSSPDKSDQNRQKTQPIQEDQKKNQQKTPIRDSTTQKTSESKPEATPPSKQTSKIDQPTKDQITPQKRDQNQKSQSESQIKVPQQQPKENQQTKATKDTTQQNQMQNNEKRLDKSQIIKEKLFYSKSQQQIPVQKEPQQFTSPQQTKQSVIPPSSEKHFFNRSESQQMQGPLSDVSVLNASVEQSRIEIPELGIKYKPDFLRRGKPIKQIPQIVKISEDLKIKSSNVKNQRNLIKDYILAENPLYYGSDRTYSDKTFPPNLSILYQHQYDEHEMVNFARCQLFLASHELVNIADPNDIVPGLFNFGSLLSALVGLSLVHPNALSRLFEDQTVTSSGFQYVRLCLNGVWRYIFVDDFLPVSGKELLCSGPTLHPDPRVRKLGRSNAGFKPEIWVSLIEKSISKFYGSFEDLEKANLTLKEAYMIIAGAPVIERVFSQSFQKEFDAFLNKYDPTKYIVQLQLRSSDYDMIYDFMTKLNTTNKIALTVIGYDKKLSEIKVRNHEGWINDPQKQPSNILKKIGNEGECTISLNDACQYFNILNVCLYQPDWWTHSIGVKQLPNSFSPFRFNLKQDGDVCLSLIQEDATFFRNNLKQKYQYSFARLLLFNEEQVLLEKAASQEKIISLSAKLPAGNYIVLICIDWNQYNSEDLCPYDATLVYYGSQDVKLASESYKDDPNFMAHCLSSEAIKQGVRIIWTPNHPNFSKDLTEYMWVCKELGFYFITWSYEGDKNITYKRKLILDPNRTLLEPLSFINPQDTINLWTLKTKELVEKRKNSWLQAAEIEILFKPKSIYSVSFKASSIGEIYDKEIFKKVGLV